jgi:hypothetical protein
MSSGGASSCGKSYRDDDDTHLGVLPGNRGLMFALPR